MAVIELANARTDDVRAEIPTGMPNGAVTVTPSDTDTFNVPTHIVPMTTGTIKVTPWRGGSDITLTYAADGSGPAPGTPVPFKCSAVKSTGTTVTQILACYTATVGLP